MRVDRCVCHDVSFEKLLILHQERGLGFRDLQRITGCSTGCGMCEAYVRLTLRTGRTSFPVLSPEEIDSVIQQSAD